MGLENKAYIDKRVLKVIRIEPISTVDEFTFDDHYFLH